MKKISENLIKPMEDADTLKGRINRKLIQNIFFIDIDRPSKMNGFTPYMFEEMDLRLCGGLCAERARGLCNPTMAACVAHHYSSNTHFSRARPGTSRPL